MSRMSVAMATSVRLRQGLWIVAVMIATLSFFVSSGLADEGHAPGKGTHLKVNGIVSKVQSGLVFIKTPWGQMSVASKAVLKDLNVGDEVDLWVNENNAVIDVHKKGEPAHAHRYVTGNLAYTSDDHKEIKLWTPEGEKTFAVQSGRSQLSSIKEGAPVTVELNEVGKVIDIHSFTLGFHFDKQPQTTAGNHIMVRGVVEKIQSGVVTVKSPSANYHLNAKTMQSDLKVGDEITLWVNGENMVVDHHKKGEAQAHRLISGKLVYVGKTKDQIKLMTPEGEKVFPLERLEVKAKPIPEGSQITVEVNEKGTVVDLWKSEL